MSSNSMYNQFGKNWGKSPSGKSGDPSGSIGFCSVKGCAKQATTYKGKCKKHGGK